MSVRKRGAQESYPRAEDLPDCLRIENVPTDDSIVESKMRTRKTITFVTGNKNKLAEVQRLLSTSSSNDEQLSIPFDIDNHQLDLPELQGSPSDIAREKCQMASLQLKTAVLTEDTCLCFHGLNGLPGPYIKWFLDGLGHDGLNKLLQGFDDKTAYAQTIIAFSPGPDKEVRLFEGKTEGRIVPARGSNDFGWDPIFEPTEDEQGSGSRKTYAEMTRDEKNAISHRGRAFHKFREYLLSDSDIIFNAIV
jgi:inosine triphosphate pyrophosphatase